MANESVRAFPVHVDGPDGTGVDSTSAAGHGHAPAVGSKAGRVTSLDFTKGALVLVMVLYHWLNYFVSPEGDFYRYLRFLTPSFIFITGFLISHVYLANPAKMRRNTPARLMQRGLKVLALFIVLNAVRAFLIPDPRAGEMAANTWTAADLVPIFLTGHVVGINGKASAFNILVPISHLLLVAALLVAIARSPKRTFHIACGLILLIVAILRLAGSPIGNVELLAIGLLGAVVGFVPIERIDAVVTPRNAVVSYLAYTALISLRDVIYLFPVQVLGVCINLMLIYAIGVRGRNQGRIYEIVTLLGTYSLFGYIMQIAVLQVLFRGLGGGRLEATALAASFFGAFALTILAVVVADRLRKNVTAADRLYRAVFA
jgi:peptidoglycan/LPS O-acetylase OafA/YrhL